MKYGELVKLAKPRYQVYGYSGRGMVGRHCAAITLKGDNEIAILAMDLVCKALTDEQDDVLLRCRLVELFKGASTDSMGKDMVIYFPSVAWELLDCEHQWIETVDDEGNLVEPASDTCGQCGEVRA